MKIILFYIHIKPDHRDHGAGSLLIKMHKIEYALLDIDTKNS